MSGEDSQDNEVRSFFGRVEDNINYFRDLLTLSQVKRMQSIEINYQKVIETSLKLTSVFGFFIDRNL